MKPATATCKATTLIAIALFLFSHSYSQTYILPYGSTWKYFDNNSRPTNWHTTGFDDAAWSSGPGQFGYGDGDEGTVVSYGSDANNKYITTYFRTSVNIPNPALYTNFTLNVKRDDAVVIYVNGTERYRSNIAGTVVHSTLATAAAADDGNTVQTTTLATSVFSAGTNVIAVEVHQSAANSTDLTFDMELLGNAAPLNYISYGDLWKFLDNGSNQGTAWRSTTFNDDSWVEDNAKFGYGGDGEATVVSYGSNSSNKYPTTYFRKDITIAGLTSINSFTLNVVRDDGMVVYVNGVEVARDNITGTPAYNSYADNQINGAGETTALSFTISPCYFTEGLNTIAVEVHQATANSGDLGFDLSLVGSVGGGTPSISRGPYLQMGSETAITFRWRTNANSIGRVRVGTSVGNYTIATASESGCPNTEHELRITGLLPDTKYYYEIGTTSGSVLQGDADNFFVTAPLASTTRKVRIAVFGDCGRNDLSYRTLSLQHYANYRTANGIDAADAWLLLGDNAYNSGLDAEYTSNFFTPFQTNIMKNHKLYPAPGNHDYYGATQASRTHAYYQNFTLPTAGECGGVSSGSEAYYSFNIGNVHFLSLDSYGTESGGLRLYDTLGPQVTWIKADLAANTRKWVVAYWHHPPYTMGSHTSDGESELVNIRFNFIRILERMGVDLILCGHSHDYERSKLLDGHYGNEVSTASMSAFLKSSSSGKYDGSLNSCVYTTKSALGNQGTVYVVAGSSGADGGVLAGLDGYPHNALPHSIDDGGMLYLEVDDNRLDAKFLQRTGVVGDQFTIIQDVNNTNSYNVIVGNQVTLTASWPGSYAWSTGPATRSINVTPAVPGTTNYTVTDGMGCLTDQFSVIATGVLPVNMLRYDVRLNGNHVDVTWTTASEENNSHFSIQRSSNGIDFTTIGTVAGANNSNTENNYAFVDNSPLTGVSYYRLAQTDLDNNTKYLGVKRIVYDMSTPMVLKLVSASNDKLVIDLSVSTPGIYGVRIYDMVGREHRKEKIEIGQANVRREFQLKAGSYVIEMTNEKSERVVQKVIIQ